MSETIKQNSDKSEPSEQNTSGKRKHKLILRVFKWIGMILLTILLVLSLVFQAPWKVITLLLIILAACTVLPRWARKWFWLSAAAVVIVLIIWVFLPEDDEGWRPYTFDEELAALQAKYAIPDEENAALIYDKLFEEMDSDSNEPDFFVQSKPSSRDGPWLSKDHPEMAEWLKARQSIIEKLLEAAQKDKCRFPIIADYRSFARYMERSPMMRRCALLLLSAGNNDIAEGRIDAGLETYFCIIRMADHLYQQPVMIDLLVGFAIEGLALTQLNKFVVESQPGGEEIELIAESIKGPEDNWQSDFIRVLEYEKLFHKNTFSSLAYQVNPQGKVRLSRDPYAAMKEEWQEELKAGKIQDPEELAAFQRILHPTYWQRKRRKANTILKWFFMPSTPQKAGEIIDAGFEKHYAMAERDFDWSKQPHKLDSLLRKTNCDRLRFDFNYFARVTADMLEESYHKVHDIYLRNLALRRGSRLLVAIRQYKNEKGSWPENLEQVKGSVPAEVLVDPITGDAFVYKLIEEDFMLYSRGKNGIDEGGIRREVVDPNAAREPVDANFFKEIQELESEFFGDAFDPNALKQMFDPNDYRPTKTVGDDVLIWPPLY